MTVLSTQRLQAIMEDRWRDLTGGTEPPQIVAHLAAAIVDSLLFLWLAFGTTAGWVDLTIGKLYMVAPAVLVVAWARRRADR